MLKSIILAALAFICFCSIASSKEEFPYSPDDVRSSISEPKKELICSTINGLCNRLRNLASCSILAEYSGRELVVCWLNDRYPADSRTLGFAKWSDLFIEPQLKIISCLPNEGVFFGGRPTWESPRLEERSLQYIPFQVDTVDQFTLSQAHSPGAEGQIDIFPSHSTVIIQTIHNIKPALMTNDDFYARKRAFYQQLVPIPYIDNAVATLSAQFPEDIVGVHIRTSDMMHQVHKKRVPAIWKYIDAMKNEIKRNPEVAFFVSSDCLQTLKFIQKIFVGRIYSYDNIEYNHDGRVNRTSTQATQDALIDLLLLSKTKRLIATKYSSFSYEAACIGGIPIITEVVH